MAYKFYNPNPVGRMTNDCSVRALSKALGVTWDEAYLKLAYNGKQMGVMPDNKPIVFYDEWKVILCQKYRIVFYNQQNYILA